MNLQEIKKQHPEYAQIPDQELADKIYNKHYSDKLSKEDYYNRIGFSAAPAITGDSTIDAYLQQAMQNQPKSSWEQLKNMGQGFDVAATRGGLGVSQLLAQAFANKEGDFGHRWQEEIERRRLANEEKAQGLANSGEADLGMLLANAVKSGPALIAGGAAAKGLGAAGSAIAPNAGPLLQAGGGMLKNILGAGAFGGVNEGMNVIPQGEERLPHVAEGAKSAATAAALFEALGLGAKVLGKVASGEAKLPNWATQEKAGKTVGEPAKALHKELSEGYESFKQDFKDAGIKADTAVSKTKKIDTGIIDPNTGKPITKTVTEKVIPTIEEVAESLPGVDTKAQESLVRALETGDVSDLMNARKDMRDYRWAEIYNGATKQGYIPNRNGIYAVDKWTTKIDKMLKDAGNKLAPDKAKEFFNLQTRWHEELGRFLDIPPIQAYIKGDLTATDLAHTLQGNTKAAKLFRAHLASEFKDIGHNKLKSELVNMGVKGSKLGILLKILGT